MSGLVTVAAVATFGWRLVTDAKINPERYGPVRSFTHQLASLSLVLAAAEVLVLGAIVVAVFSTVGYLLAFWGFTLTRGGAGTLHLTRGLFTTRATTIEERRLRGVEFSEPLLLRAVGGARCIAVTTGLRVGRGAERGGSMLVPPVRAELARTVGGDVLGSEAPLRMTLTPHPRVALRRRINRIVIAVVVLTATVGAVTWRTADWTNWVVGTAVVGLVLGIPLAVDRYRSLGHVLVDDRLVVCQGSLVRRRTALATAGIIGVNLRQSFFQRRAGVVTVTATTAAGRQRYELIDVTYPEAVAVADQVLPGILTPFITGSTA
jgi:putative membrane protein